MALRDLSLGELAITIPRATLLFRQHDMDFCCGGKQTLLRVATKKTSMSMNSRLRWKT